MNGIKETKTSSLHVHLHVQQYRTKEPTVLSLPFILQATKLSLRLLTETFNFSDGGSLTWEQPPPNETVQSANPVDHSSSRQLYEGTINATLNWQFRLNQLNFDSLVISLNGTPIAGVGSSGSGLQPGFENEFGIDWNPNQKLIKLFIFKVTIEKNGTFTCQVDADEVTGFVTKNIQFRSNVQVHVVGK